MPQQPSIAIVIPAYNEERLIGTCLEACIRQTSVPDEIIVVNNRSTDNTESIVRHYQEDNPHIDIHLVDQHEYQGITPTRNCGFDHARSDVIARVDADSVIADNWVETVRRRFQDPAIDAASGPQFFYDMPLPRFTLWVDNTLRARVQRITQNERFLLGTNMAIRATAWKAVRHLTQLDLEDRLHEDVELAMTLFKNDFEVTYEPAMVVGTCSRRLECSAREFYQYAMRHARTTELHGIPGLQSRAARTQVIALILVYFPARAIRFFYDTENRRFTSSKLREKVRELSRRPGRAEERTNPRTK
ncbi:MAG TPA: glycosyltransferase family A protein [Mycobacterium sp.]|nr:glycosyltransferase family A protein [Mycobacterium sp.]HTX96653.1 glycosyltransferase family A protein [Mycobacterium sp.]